MNTKNVGTVATGAVMSKLLKSGCVVLLPVGDNERYDIVIEKDNKFQRVQCKAGRVKNGSVFFDTSSTNYTKGHWHRVKYTNQVDYFGVYCAENDETYLIPAKEVDSLYGANLRLEPTKNNQAKNIRFAKDYKL